MINRLFFLAPCQHYETVQRIDRLHRNGFNLKALQLLISSPRYDIGLLVFGRLVLGFCRVWTLSKKKIRLHILESPV